MADTQPKEWYQLTEMERYRIALTVLCPRCLANKYTDCMHLTLDGPELARRYAWTGLVSMHTERENAAKQRYQGEIKVSEALAAYRARRDANEAARTCPWCGFLAPSRQELTDHEVGCE